MFWRFGGYANVSAIDSILEKENVQLEELLEESDLVQELKQHNARLVEYLRDQAVLEKLLEYVVAPKLEPVAAPDVIEDDREDEDERGKGLALPFARSRANSRAATSQEDMEKKRNRYAFLAAEILSSDTWSIYEALLESKPLLRNFWQFLKRPTPLDPLQASYFTKVNESLFDKKTEEMLSLLKSMDGAIADILKHVDCPMIMDLLLKIISLERTESGQGIVEWLYTQDVMPTLLSFLGPEHSWSTQTSAADFMKAIITVSANASQNEQTCIGPNELTRQLVSKPCVEQLIKYMLSGGNPLTCGVGIVIEVIRKNNSDYDPEGVDINTTPSSRDPIYLGTLLRLFAQHVPDFMNLIMNAPAQKERLASTFGGKIEPLGFDRFKTCELMAELLHCSNMGLLNEVGSEEFIATRDEQRQRLRAQGRLLPVRGAEEPPSSVEDLTMRLSHSSPAEEGRKLEVTNSSADDDGFEEVTHTADEDNSHGVEELPDLSSHAPTSSFLNKDEDDFVDEPLSSPRLHVRELDVANVEEPPVFEEPDLVVAPLSPSKKSAVLASSATAAEKVDNVPPPNDSTPSKKPEPLQPPAIEHLEKPATAVASEVPTTTSLPSDATAGSETSGMTEKAQSSTDPEAIPAPLVDAANPSPALQETAAPPAAPAAPIAENLMPETQKEPSDRQPEKDGENTQPESGGPSSHEIGSKPQLAAVEPEGESTTPAGDVPSGPKPVVGDYLKMQFVEQRVVPTILGFFFTYPWNNFLHNVVYDIVQQVFNGPMDRGYNPTVAVSLFEQADITNQIINGQLASEKSQAENRTRMGYMGHLTLIAEEVVKFTERHPPELLSDVVLEKVMAQDWINYVEGALAETRERDNAILGGVRPEVAMSNRAAAAGLMGGLSGLNSIGLSGNGGSNALAEAGLNGGSETSENSGSSGVGPFALSAGTLMSGFGSSSDEEDDEEQESEEDVNNEFRAYTDPLNANSSASMNPPSIPPPPPPPPPLNIPPSRARLQLAARLAMNKRNAAAAANGSQDGISTSPEESTSSDRFSLPNMAAGERLRNPFADDEDDEDGSGSGSGSDGEVENVGGESISASAWNRGSWWRGVVRGARRSNRATTAAGKGSSQETERFGDGRDDSDDSDGPADDVEDDMEDEEFGDFAMPEVENKESDTASSSRGLVSGIDPAREKILVKPLPLHPSSLKSVSSFGSLWPFSSQPFGAKKEEGEKKDEAEEESGGISEEPVELVEKAEEEGVVGEDGKKIDRAVEATRRTSIEDPDDDEVVVGEEIIGQRPAFGKGN